MVVLWTSVAALVPYILLRVKDMGIDPVPGGVLAIGAVGLGLGLMQLINWVFSAGNFSDDGKPKKPK